MPINYLKKVLSLSKVKSPTEAPSQQDWTSLEHQFQMTFPKDFKALVTGLGSGHFGVGLNLRNPVASSPYLVLSKKALKSYASVLVEAAENSGVNLFPKRGGLVPIGHIDRQVFLFQPSETEHKLQDELVWWDTNYERVTNLNMPISRFIHDLYLNRIKDDWASRLRNYFWRDETAPFFTSRASNSGLI